MTPLDIAKKKNNQETIKLLTEYFPTEEEKLVSQLEYKQRVDLYFEDVGVVSHRFLHEQIDLKYHSLLQCLNAVRTGNLELLTEYILHIDVSMGVSLTLIAIERDHIHLIGCLFEKLIRERAFVVRHDTTIEPLLYIGFDPTPYSEFSVLSKPSSEVVKMVKIVTRSRVLCLFKILYHKYIFLDINSIFDLVQVLMLEDLY